VLNREENRAEAADILRSLIDRIELTPNRQGKLDIDLYGDLAGILSLAGKKIGHSIRTTRPSSRLRWLRGLATPFIEPPFDGREGSQPP
jgi:site-specific DNA recombinase